MVNCWFGLVVWIPKILLWKALLLKGTPRIPNHRAPNQQLTISSIEVGAEILDHHPYQSISVVQPKPPNSPYCWTPKKPEKISPTNCWIHQPIVWWATWRWTGCFIISSTFEELQGRAPKKFNSYTPEWKLTWQAWKISSFNRSHTSAGGCSSERHG